MKKNFMKTALVAVFCFAAGYIAYNAQNKNEKLSELALANVEALAEVLPVVTIICGAEAGDCWVLEGECWLDNMGFLRIQDCHFSGYMGNSCYTLC